MTAPARTLDTTPETTTTTATATATRAATDALVRDFGLLAVRLVGGLLMAGHGAQKLFGWWGGPDFDFVVNGFGQAGYTPAKFFALLASSAELLGGLFLALGFLTPLACAAIIGVMFNAVVAVHWKSGAWTQNGGYELPLLLGVIAVAVACTGPGQLSLDRGWRWATGGAASALTGVGLGLAGGLVAMAVKAL
ncbi:MAG: DoxX family protein [Acidimicrobiia bacterium]